VHQARGKLVPQAPVFATKSEQAVWESLRDSLQDGEALVHGLRFTDPHDGDIEIDLLLLSPSLGAAAIEVKGGLISYRDGEWTTTSSSGRTRRIHPVAQARRARHALRRYLDRQPTWSRDLLRSQWFVVFPHTRVDGDMGPEGRREQIIDSQQVDIIRSVIDAALPPLPAPLYGNSAWVDQAVELLLTAPDASLSATRWADAVPMLKRRRRPMVVAMGGLVVAGTVAFAAFGWPGASAGPSTTTTGSTQVRVASGTGTACDPAYSPCVLTSEDRDCPDIGFRVSLTGADDPYGLDRDGDGQGCESFPVSARGEAH
jgi:hypothetical protein